MADRAPARPRPGPRVTGAGGVEVATWDMGGSGPPVLLAHATGFHAWTWLALAEVLGETNRVWAIDQRGHGSSGHTPDGDYRDWSLFATDILAVVDALGLEQAGGVGHSLGGAALILAEQRRPGTFSGLWCYEPIVVPPTRSIETGDGNLATLSRRRRPGFDSRQAAIENFRSKAPFAAFAPGVLESYVEHGFVDTTSGGVTLSLAREEEATVYEGAARHDAFEHLGELDLPVTFAGSGADEPGPVMVLPALAALVRGARIERFDRLSHFGPMEDPGRIARSVARDLAEAASRSTGHVPPRR